MEYQIVTVYDKVAPPTLKQEAADSPHFQILDAALHSLAEEIPVLINMGLHSYLQWQY